MRNPKPALRALALVVMLGVLGCGQRQETFPPDAADSEKARSVPNNDRENAIRPANMPESERPNDVRRQADNPLIRGIRLQEVGTRSMSALAINAKSASRVKERSHCHEPQSGTQPDHSPQERTWT